MESALPFRLALNNFDFSKPLFRSEIIESWAWIRPSNLVMDIFRIESFLSTSITILSRSASNASIFFAHLDTERPHLPHPEIAIRLTNTRAPIRRLLVFCKSLIFFCLSTRGGAYKNSIATPGTKFKAPDCNEITIL